MQMPSDLDIIEQTIEEAQSHIDTRDKLLRLQENKDFQDLFIEGLDKEAIRLVSMLAHPGVRSNSERMEILNSRMNFISEFHLFSHQIIQTGDSAADAMKAHERTREEILEEDTE